MIQRALLRRPEAGPQAPAGLAGLPGGGLLVADPLGHRLWAWRPGHAAAPVAGTGRSGGHGDGGPASRAELAAPCVIRLDGAGRVTLLERDACGSRVRRIGADGRLVTLYRAPARREVSDLAVAPDGTVYLALQELTGGAPWVARLADGGRLEPVYGGEGAAFSPDLAIGAAPDGALYILHGGSLWRHRPGQRLTLQAQDERLAPSRYDGSCLAVLPDGQLVLTFAEAGRVVRLDPETGAWRTLSQADPWVCRCVGSCVHAPAYPAVDAGGRVWAIDGLKRRVVRLGQCLGGAAQTSGGVGHD